MSKGQIQMTLYSIAVAAVAFAGLVYVAVNQPDYLRATRNGVPYFTPKVVNPLGGQPLDLNMLVRHYKGETP